MLPRNNSVKIHLQLLSQATQPALPVRLCLVLKVLLISCYHYLRYRSSGGVDTASATELMLDSRSGHSKDYKNWCSQLPCLTFSIKKTITIPLLLCPGQGNLVKKGLITNLKLHLSLPLMFRFVKTEISKIKF